MDIDLTNPTQIEELVDSIKQKKEENISHLIAEIDRLKSQITAQQQELKEELKALFLQLEAQALKLPEPQKRVALTNIANIQLRSMEFLGILAETAESAILNALERGENIEETVREIAKDLTYDSIDYQVEKTKIFDVSYTILHVAATIAQSSVNYSDEILKGAIVGIKLGIKKSIRKFNEIMEYTPDEAKRFLISNYEQIVKDLQQLDTIYKEAVTKAAMQSEPGISDKMLSLSQELNIFDKLKAEAQKSVESLKALISQELVNRASEAKKLGLMAFEKAKEKIDKALKEAKDAINK